MEKKLPNYLRSQRKRLGLSQADMAQLLGNKHSAKLSRYEQFRREPKLETALMCGFITREPLNTLFEGVYREAEKKVRQRARSLLTRYRSKAPTSAISRKVEILESILMRK